MKGAKFFKLFKKGAKAASKQKGKKGPAKKSSWPSGTRIGIFGHANAGKTVYLTVLNEECKISKKLQISVTDNRTAGEFLSNYRSIWGLGSSDDAGTVVDFRGDKQFPDPTTSEKILSFNAILDHSNRLPCIVYDYSGKAVSISESHDAAEQVIDFMSGCDGILFFYDPKLLGAELESQAHVAAFVNMLEKLAPLSSHRLPIPIGVVVTKADILPGYKGDAHVHLIASEDEHLISEEFDLFYEKILSLPRVATDSEWAGSVRNILFRLKDFLRVILKRTLDFQLFFVSATGVTPEKIGTDVGRSLYNPPEKMQPVGVKEPFYWLLNAIIRNKRISTFRRAAKYVSVASIIWLILLSLPYGIHFGYLFKKPFRVEQSYLSGGRGIESLARKERSMISRAFTKYKDSRLTKSFLFEDFQAPTLRILELYKGKHSQEAKKKLKIALSQFLTVVEDTTMWPLFINPTDSIPVENSTHLMFLSVFEEYHKTDTASDLYAISDRALERWRLFLEGTANPGDIAKWQVVQNRISADIKLAGDQLTSEEKKLGKALANIKVATVKKEEVKATSIGLGDLIDKINSSSSPKYRLKSAVATLKDLQGKVDQDSERKIGAYLRDANKWKKSRKFTYKITSIPDAGHLHVEVVDKGKEPVWSADTGEQILPGIEYSLTWKMGQTIHIAYDAPTAAESWGKQATDRRVLKGDFAIFDFEGDITLPTLGKTVSITINPTPADLLPEMQ